MNHDGVRNYIAYALGIDPVGGISSAQHDPRTAVISIGDSSSLSFQLPSNGRPDLRYRVQTTTDLDNWTTIGTKDGTAPWNIGSIVTEDAISPNLSIVKRHDRFLQENHLTNGLPHPLGTLKHLPPLSLNLVEHPSPQTSNAAKRPIPATGSHL